MSNEVQVKFQPSGRSVYVLPSTSVLEAAARAGIILQTPCGGNGTCGKCRIKLISGECTSDHRDGLTDEQISEGYRLACQTRVESSSVIEIPESSNYDRKEQILTADAGEIGLLKPAIRKVFFELRPPTSDDQRSDVTRFRDSVGQVGMSHDMTKALPPFLRSNDWRGTAVLYHDNLIGLERRDTAGAMFGVALDIGTTTVVGTLFDLASGQELGVASRLNAQVNHGDDVLSRILKVREDAAALRELQKSILGTVNEIVTDLSTSCHVPLTKIYELALAGNSTMQQLLCGYDSSALGEVPFVQVFDESQVIAASRLGIKANKKAKVFIFPQVGGFIGGDTVAGAVASRLDKVDGPTLLVDIGTNGEIVLSANGKLEATSTAAGPAFEGARIVQGMRAMDGAIEKVLIIGEDVTLNVIGDAPPAGICGTALIDATAELLRAGILDSTGRILSADEVPDTVSPQLRERLVTKGDNTDFMLASAASAASGEPVILFQRDIRELQLATGAIRAGINILLRRANIVPEELSKILLAGAFGNFIRRKNARRIGLLPAIPRERIRFIGNAASLGAKLALLSTDERDYADRLRDSVEHVDLSLDPEFQMEFGAAMIFPESEPEFQSGT